MALTPTKRVYTLDPAKRELFQDMYVTRRMVNDPLNISVLYDPPYNWIEHIVNRLYAKDWVQLKGTYFAATALGREKLVSFQNRFYDYLKMFDGFHSLNYENETFAIASYLDMDDATYNAYVNDDAKYGWRDYRVAVAERKGLDPLEIVYMSFLFGGKFDNHPSGWQFAIASGEMWDQVVRIVNDAIHMDQLAVPERGISCEENIDAIITAGSELFISLMQRQQHDDAARAAQKAAQIAAEQVVDEIVETTETTTVVYETTRYVERVEPVYYGPAYYNMYTVNPLYLSPIWYDPYW